MSDASVVGWFTLGAGALTTAITGFWTHVGRKSDQEARTEERLALERERWRETGASVLAKVRPLVTDLHPTRVMGPLSKERVPEVGKALTERWEQVREPLARLEGHPSKETRDLAEEVSVGLHKTHNRLSWALSEFARDRNWAELHRDAVEDWEKVNELVRRLREALQE